MTDNHNLQSEDSTNPRVDVHDQEDSRQKVCSNDNSEKEANDNNDFEEQFEGNDEQEEQVETESFGLIDSPSSLKRKEERIHYEMTQKTDEYDNLNKKIAAIVNRLKSVIDPLEENGLKEKKLELEQERSVIKKELEYFEKEVDLIKAQFQQYESIKRKNYNNSLEHTESIKLADDLPKSLFENGDPIEHTLLYAATFFSNLSPYDFERVVDFLLEGRTTTVKVKSQITKQQGETKIVEIVEESQERLLTDIWKESLQHPDKFLSDCLISSVILEDDSQVIDFVSLELKEEFKNYFKQEQPFYLLEQFKRARFLFFDQKNKVAICAMSLSVDMAITSPDTYGKEWLFEIITRWGTPKLHNNNSDSLEPLVDRLLKKIKPEKKRLPFVYGRISSLIAQMLDRPRLKSVVDGFFNKLINEKSYDLVLEIVKRTFSHPEFDGFYWLKQLLHRGDEKIKDKTYRLLYHQLDKNDLYIYDLLEKIKPWLSESSASPDEYSQSDKYFLRLLPEYCDEKIKKLEPKQYGKFPPQYSLLVPLYTNDSFEEKLEVLFAWLLHPGIKTVVEFLVNENATSKQVVVSSSGKEKLNIQSPTILISELLRNGYASQSELVDHFFPLLLTEWCIIVWGLDNKEPDTEAWEMINNLIQQVVKAISIADKKHKALGIGAKNFQQEYLKKLVECWSILKDYLLNKADFYRSSGENELKKQYMHRRTVVKYLNDRFKTLKK